MKTVKLTQSMMKDPTILLKKSGAVREQAGGLQSYPSHVYMNPKDYKRLQKNLAREFRKEKRYLSKHALENSVGMYMLNYGPVEVKGIKEGYVVVNETAIDAETEQL